MDILKTDWAYLAGFLDGEGYFAIIRHRKKAHSKRRAEIILRLLNFRSKGSMVSAINQKIRPLIEQYYLDLEAQFQQAIYDEKPWLHNGAAPTHARPKHPFEKRTDLDILKESKNYSVIVDSKFRG